MKKVYHPLPLQEPPKNYILTMPANLSQELAQIADRHGLILDDLMRKFIRLGLVAVRVEEDSDSAILIMEGNTTRRLRIFDEPTETIE